ncbi:hypothetical protein T484DRAFT_1744200 [Baffinella frigidus]|nr:hypothetical protein T484DRAFT_1744200 [Cryptophyta sp. CCMP2293]
MMMPRALALALLMATAADAFYGVGVLPCSLKRGMPKLHLSSANLGRSAPLLRAAATSTRRASKGGLCMQWKEEQPLPYQAQWEAFQNYNTGRWKGRCIHISPETGDYTEPYIQDSTVDVWQLEEGVQSAKQRLTLGNDTAPLIEEYVLTVNDE